jgi:hypothetical protein
VHYVWYIVAEILIVWCSTPTVDYVAAWAVRPYIIAVLQSMISCRRTSLLQGVPSTSCSFFLIAFCFFFADWRLQQKALQELFD